MIKKLIYFLLGIIVLLFIAFFLQPLKKESGYDAKTKYEIDSNWLALPAGMKLGNPTGIDLDTHQHVVVLHRADREWPLLGAMPKAPIAQKTVLVIDKDNGRLLHSWGDHLFVMPHGLAVDHDNNIWITDVGLHQVFKFSNDERLLLKLGEAGIAGADSTHFNKPTGVAIAKDGSFYVSDGYGNNRIVKFSADGKYLFEWGKKGNNAGEFNLPHGIALDRNGDVYVADRENNRIQVFGPAGRFIKQLSGNSWGAVNAVGFDPLGLRLIASDDVAFLKMKHRGSDIFMFNTAGNVQTRIGRSGFYNGPVSWYHDIAMDKEGNIYTGDILGNTIQKFRKITK